MSGKKWFLMFLSALLSVFLFWGVLNVLTDPFNAFGDRFMNWDSYTQTLNPRNSKAVYISSRFDRFDGYVIGSSSAASFLPETINKYTGCTFYNMFHYGADTDYDRTLVEWLLKNDDDVKEIFLILGLNEAIEPAKDTSLTDWEWYPVSGENKASYYTRFLFANPKYAMEKLYSRCIDTMLPQPFDVFLPEDGTYDKRVRDVEPIGSLEDYMELHGEDFPTAESFTDLAYTGKCAENVRAIRSLCQEKNVHLTVVLAPVSAAQLSSCTDSTLNRYYNALSEVTDYWNFQISPITEDARYFYDITHTRQAAIDMVLARMFGDDEIYYPESFGTYCAEMDPPDAETLRQASDAGAAQHSVTVPILLYHHFTQDPENSITELTPDAFAHQMHLLQDEGFQAVTFNDLIGFVKQGTPLPEKPVLITMDDGYYSNYSEAFPILQEMQMPASIFVIGCSVGHMEYYKDTDYPLIPHFGAEEIRQMCSSGLISIQSHTYDMHQWEQYESLHPARTNILPFEKERQEEYAAALEEDIRIQNDLFAELGLQEPNVLAFPSGLHDTITDVILCGNGYQVTLTSEENRVNTVICGLPQSLIDLGRKNIQADTSDSEILAYLRKSAY